MTTLERISEFLGLPPDVINKVDRELREKMLIACNADDYMALHHLGYLIRKEV